MSKKWRFQYGRLKCEFILNFNESIVTCLTAPDIFDDESVNLIFRNKKIVEQNSRPKIKFKYKLG